MTDGRKITITSLYEKVRRGDRLSMVALYDYPSAVVAQEAGVDILLVGDSVAMTVYGQPDTLQADMAMMIRHTQAVRRGAPDVFLVGDMPYLSYQTSAAAAIRNAGRFLAEGRAEAVKLEGGHAVVRTVARLVRASIPVVGHLGFLPQSSAMTGGVKVQGREADSALSILDQARALEQAGICLLVLECVPPNVSEALVRRISVPVIGIGSGPACHGQVQVIHDLLGLLPGRAPRFVRKFTDLQSPAREALQAYVRAVGTGEYPTEDHCYRMKPGEDEEFARRLADLK